jgi:peptidoglycan-N-acetylglucosamine deacetylase
MCVGSYVGLWARVEAARGRGHHAVMSALPASRAHAPHRIPRYPHAWLIAFALSQAVVAGLWWRYGAAIGGAALMASHAPFWWATFWPRASLFGPNLARLPVGSHASEKFVWLTIDDGPSDDTPAILDALDAHGAKATFFLVGQRAKKYPDLVREIALRGHDIGNHSTTHPSAWFWALGPRRLTEEIGQAQHELHSILGKRPRWFRGVVGMSNPLVYAVLKHHALARVSWSARGYDAVSTDAARVVARIERGLAPGAIVLLHEGAAHGGNVDTIRCLLQRLDALGYRAVLP